MISLQNFAPQEKFNGEFPDLINDESISAEFDAFLHLFSVVPTENNMFSKAEIPEELNENPIGLQSLENPEIDAAIIPTISSLPIEDTSEQTTSVLDEVSTALFKTKSFDTARETEPGTEEFQIPLTETGVSGTGQKLEAVSQAFRETGISTLTQHGESKSVEPSTPVSETTVLKDVAESIKSFTKNIQTLNTATQEVSRGESPPALINVGEREISLGVNSQNPNDLSGEGLELQKPLGKQPPLSSEQVKQNLLQQEVANSGRKTQMSNPASDQNVSEELGFRVLSTDEKPSGLGRTDADVSSYPKLVNEKSVGEKRQSVLPNISEIISEAKVTTNASSKNVDPTSETALRGPAFGAEIIPEDSNKPLIKTIGEKIEFDIQKKQAGSIQQTIDLGAAAKGISTPKFEAALEAKTIADVQAKEVAKQIETPLLDLASLETENADPKLLKFRLKPAELGMVEIRLEKNLAGKLEVHFHAENDTAKQLLAESFEHLRSSLQNAGWQVEQMEISSGPLSPNGFESREDQSRKNESASSNKSTNIDETPESEDDLPQEDPNRLVSLRA